MPAFTENDNILSKIVHTTTQNSGSLTTQFPMLAEFKADLPNLTSIQMIRKYILNANCNMLTNDLHYQLREEVCEQLKVEFNNVIVVGSGKLGFSIKPNKRYHLFGDDSDLDVAIISENLFEQVWKESYIYKKEGAFWPKSSSFFKYLSEGWIRPDKLPPSTVSEFAKHWWDFFNDMSASKRYGQYKIRAGLYHSMFFFQEYQKICIEQCAEEIN